MVDLRAANGRDGKRPIEVICEYFDERDATDIRTG